MKYLVIGFALLGIATFGCDNSDDVDEDGGIVIDGDTTTGADGDTDTDSDSDSDTETESTHQPFVDCDGGKYDPENNLCWQDPQIEEKMVWDEAVEYCDNLDLGSSTDWRLPIIDELMTLVRGCNDHLSTCPVNDPGCLDSTCDDDCKSCRPIGGEVNGPGQNGCYWEPTLTGECDPNFHWSSSANSGSETRAWSVNFDSGGVHGSTPRTSSLRIRCVRTGM